MRSIIQAMKEVIIELSGEFKQDNAVKRIDINSHKAVKIITDKSEIASDIIISNVDIGTTYEFDTNLGLYIQQL